MLRNTAKDFEYMAFINTNSLYVDIYIEYPKVKNSIIHLSMGGIRVSGERNTLRVEDGGHAVD